MHLTFELAVVMMTLTILVQVTSQKLFEGFRCCIVMMTFDLSIVTLMFQILSRLHLGE